MSNTKVRAIFDHDMSFVFSDDIERWMKGGVRFCGRERAKKSHQKRKESINKTVGS